MGCQDTALCLQSSVLALKAYCQPTYKLQGCSQLTQDGICFSGIVSLLSESV